MTRTPRQSPERRAALGRLSAFLACLSVAAVPSAAQDVNCADPGSQTEMNICAARDHDSADGELNRVYRDVRAMAQAMDRELPPNLAGIEAQLIAGQRGWIAYRDGHCGVVGAEARGGTMEPLLIATCTAELTRQRTRELSTLLTPR